MYLSWRCDRFKGAGNDECQALSLSDLQSAEPKVVESAGKGIEQGLIEVLKRERIIVSKKAAGRDKDKLVLPVLSDAL